nr:putative transposase [uncultured bacterium]
MRSWDPPFWIGDRLFTEEEMTLITYTVRQFKQLSRQELQATICENMPWKAPNGQLKLAACRLLLEKLETSGLIELPSKKKAPIRKVCEIAPIPCIPQEGLLKQYLPVTVDPVSLEGNNLWNATVAAYHPLGYRQPVGAHQRYWINSHAEGRVQVLGALLFAAAARKVAVREAWIGWTTSECSRFRYRIVNNSRFLLLPRVKIPNLASHTLGLVAQRIRTDWQKRYGYAPVLFETFVTPPHKGTCYRAANWHYIGETAGLGREPQGQKTNPMVRLMFVYELIKEWRNELCAPTPVMDGDFDA